MPATTVADILAETTGLKGRITEALSGALASQRPADVQNMLTQLQLAAQRLDQAATKQELPALAQSVREKADSLRSEAARLRRQFQAAQLEASQSQKKELLGGSGILRRRNNTAGEQELQQSAEITARLRTTTQMLAAQVKAGSSVLEDLADARQTMDRTSSEFKAMETSVDKSQGLLTKMKRENVIDYAVIMSGLAIFVLTVLYIVYVRTIGRFF
eukprot:m.291199 g.291199  ORF g.291199 m.291199 type:complete len:216 (+) comp12434_c0_seq1:76-723(+)